MTPARRNLCFCWLILSLTAGCGLNTPVLQRGGSGRLGMLLNYSYGAELCDPIDPSKPTIVVTNGWNPLPNCVRSTLDVSAAQAIQCRTGDAFNLLSWDWNAVRVAPFPGEPVWVGRLQGVKLADALRARGVVPSRTQIIAHSLGSVVAAQAAQSLSDLGPMAQLTLLDFPAIWHDEVFGAMDVRRHACYIENYWAPGLSGHGAPVDCPGVYNCSVNGATPIQGTVDLSLSNHVYTMMWYYDTILCPSIPCGFQNSVLLRRLYE